jgi:mevalonate kinase
MGTGQGYGKTILFGEHFVVYGLPAIASALGSKTIATVTGSDGQGWTVDDQRPATPGYKEKKFNEAQQAIQNVLNHLKINTKTQKLEIKFGGDLYAASGVGGSAAQCASLARALNDEFGLQLNDEQINATAYEGEKGYHGTPSGIDNTAATYGGMIWFIRNLSGGPNTIDRLQSPTKIPLVIANTGVTASTTEVVADVRHLKEKKPQEFEAIFSEYQNLVEDAKNALLKGDIPTIGTLMDQNHQLLQKITVSGELNDKLAEIARNNGATGAKMTGTGRGGLVIAVAPNEATQDQIAEIIEKEGYTVWKTTVG